MSRWSHNPEAAADALILRSLDDIAVSSSILVAGQSTALPAALRQRGAGECVVWSRRLAEGATSATITVSPWPPAGPFALAFVRLPKARDEQAMTIHAALGALERGGRLILYGGNDEGIRGAAAVLEEIAGAVETLAARGHGRVLAARRPADGSAIAGGLRTSLAAWRRIEHPQIAGRVYDTWITYPGCFSAGRVDEGTALLLTALPPLAAGARVVDYGCGTGTIAAALLARQPELVIDAMDNDSVALEAAAENVPAARPIIGTSLAAAGGRRYHAIVSNPPLHQGFAEDHRLLERLIADAPAHLTPGGLIQIVVQRRVPLDRLLGAAFASVETVAENGRYRVWRAREAIGGNRP